MTDRERILEYLRSYGWSNDYKDPVEALIDSHRYQREQMEWVREMRWKFHRIPRWLRWILRI